MKFKALLLLLTIPALSNSMDKFPLIGAGIEPNLKTVTGSLISWVLTVTGHEFGHALVGKLLFNSPIHIHIGTSINPKDNALFKIGGLHIHGLPLCGFAVVNPDKEAISIDDVIDQRKKKIAVEAAGPIAGLVTGVVVQALLNKIGFGSLYSRLPQIGNLINLIPMRSGSDVSDGASIWENIKTIKYLMAEKKFVENCRKQ